jgi:hypothetical protein
MRRLLLTVAVTTALTTAVLGAAAKTIEGSGGNDCVFSRTIDNWTALDDRNLIIWAPRRHAYLVELSFPLHSLRYTVDVGIVDRNHDGRICGFGTDRVFVPGNPTFPEDSTILSMTRLNDDLLRALGERYEVDLKR